MNNKVWEPIDFTIYFSFIRWFALSLLVLEALFRIWSSNLDGGFLFEQKEVLAWVLRIVIFAVLGWRVIKNFGHSIMVAVISGALMGFVVGIIISIFRFYEGFKVWKFFNIITETTLVILVGVLISVLMVFILSFKKNNN